MSARKNVVDFLDRWVAPFNTDSGECKELLDALVAEAYQEGHRAGRAEENEACAQVAENHRPHAPRHSIFDVGAEKCIADQIRERRPGGPR